MESFEDTFIISPFYWSEEISMTVLTFDHKLMGEDKPFVNTFYYF